MSNKYICFVRHADSTKNRDARFAAATEDRKGELTDGGIRQVGALASDMSRIVEDLGCKSAKIFAGNSGRAKLTAEILAEYIQAPLEVFNSLTSIDAGAYAGLTETDVMKIDPNFSNDLALYRAGLLSSYNIRRPTDAENLVEFEERIERCLLEIEGHDADIKIVVAHRSPITAMLLNLSRRHMQYPKDFFGYVDLKTAHYTIFDYKQNMFICINELRYPTGLT